MEYQCSVCKQKVMGDMIVYMDHTQKHIIDLVKHDHPDWVEQDGICQQCVSYYEQELKGGFFGDAKCALRRRKTRKIFDTITSFFRGGKS